MPVETRVTRCGNCGATIQPTPGVESVRCGYCNQTTWLAPTTHATGSFAAFPGAAPSALPGDGLLARAAAGPLRNNFGEGRRGGPGVFPLTDALLAERAIWPAGAEASSTFGGGWSPATLLGPPRVYPRYGDITGAWAPGPANSAAEWIEVSFNAEVPASAIRVFETNRAGSTYAIVDTSHGEELLYARPPETRGEATVLEVPLAAPRVIRSLRVFVVNPGWAEIDAVCLLAAAPLPQHLRTFVPPPSRAGSAGCLIGLAALALVIAGVVTGAVLWGGNRAATSPHATRPSVSARLPGAVFAYSVATPEHLAARGISWASVVAERSSEYSSTRNAASAVVGPPDVYPSSGDEAGAWASRETDGGDEWITVRFAAPLRASSVVWAETFNPGAVVRVDDVTDPAAPVALWEGGGVASAPAVVGEVMLPAPRVIGAVRVVLDTRRVAGWNEIDAIGLVPAAH